MSELITVNYNNQRVLTTKQLAEIYETKPLTLTQNFNNNSKHFIEGIHYYLLKGSDLKAFKDYIDNIYVVGKHTPHLYLWTERGANRHCKILDTDKAWEQFDNFEETYFRVKDYVQNKFTIPRSFSEALRLAADVQEENERLKEQEKLLLPKATGYDLIVDNKCTQSMNAFAKSMNWGRNRLYDTLRRHGIFIDGTTTPKQQYINQKYFIVKQCQKGNMTFPVTFITTKGIDYVVRKVKEWGIIDELLNTGLMAI